MEVKAAIKEERRGEGKGKGAEEEGADGNEWPEFTERIREEGEKNREK